VPLGPVVRHEPHPVLYRHKSNLKAILKQN
jgi:hypothetical protein